MEPESLYCNVAGMFVLASMLAACGRTPLDFEQSVVPEDPPVECRGWPGEIFVNYAQAAPGEAEATTMTVYPSRGDGTFGASMKIDMKEPFTGVVVHDFDHDGTFEIHAWMVSTGVEVLLQYSCMYKMWLMVPNFNGSAPPRHDFLSIGDVNNDGYIDSVGWVPAKNAKGELNEDAFEVYTSFGGPNGTFVHEKSGLNLADVVKYWLASTRHVRDMDGDGCADLVAVRYDHGGAAKSTVYLAKGDCAGHFEAPPKIHSMPFPGTGNDIGDVDGDGAVDLILGLDDDGDPGQAWIARGNGAGALEEPIPVFDVSSAEEGHDGAGFGSVFLYDWDHDAQLDALSVYTTGPDFASPQLDIRLNRGNLEFGVPLVLGPAPPTTKQWLVGPASN